MSVKLLEPVNLANDLSRADIAIRSDTAQQPFSPRSGVVRGFRSEDVLDRNPFRPIRRSKPRGVGGRNSGQVPKSPRKCRHRSDTQMVDTVVGRPI